MTPAPDGTWTVALTRPQGKVAAGRRALEARGFRVLEAPLLEVEPHSDPAFAEVLAGLTAGRFGHVVVTSSTGVRYALEAAQDAGERLPALLAAVPVVAIGPRTAAACRDAGIAVHAVPDDESSEGLVAWFRRHATTGSEVAVVRSTRGSAVLTAGLREAGFPVLEATVYHLARPAAGPRHRRLLDATLAGEVDAFPFTSSLTVAHLLAMAREAGVETELREALARGVVAAIGEPTRRTLEEAGVAVDVVPQETTFEALAEALARERDRRR